MATTEFDLGRCLEQVRQQDQDAARLLVEQLYPQVIRIIRCHLPRRVSEEDLAQEVFLKLFSRLDQYEPRTGVPFEHWVSRLTVRTCLDALRAERRRPELRWGDLSEAQAEWLHFMLSDAPAPEPRTTLGAQEIIETLLMGLPAPDRLVITLLDLEQKSVKEVARLTGWSSAAVKVRAFRVRRKLRAAAIKLNQKECYDEL